MTTLSLVRNGPDASCSAPSTSATPTPWAEKRRTSVVRLRSVKHLQGALERTEGALVLRLSGNADNDTRGELESLIEELEEEVFRLPVADVELNVRDLYFMSSKCLAVLAQWVDEARRARPLPCRVRVTCNENLPWQRRQLGAMVTRSSGHVRLE